MRGTSRGTGRRRTRPGERNPAEAGSSETRVFVRWIVLGILVGVAAGGGSILFFWLLESSTHLFLGHLAGYTPPAPLGEGNHAASEIGRPWALSLVVALGGLLSGLLVFLVAPEAEGHGTDAAIEAFHAKAGRVRARVIPVKTIASALTIGAGGSAGREGPAAQISAGVGSLLGQWLGLNARERRMLVATGVGAGIGAIFRAPLGGAVLAAEILYTHDLEIEVLFPSLIASIVGYSIFGSWAGWEPIFGAQPDLAFDRPEQLLYYGLLGLLAGAVGVIYARVFYGTTDMFHRLRLPNWAKPALAGLVVGLIGLKIPEVIGTGYGWLQMGMSEDILAIPLWVLLLIPFVKILTTSLSIGSGGSGGIFGPGMVIGGMLGAAFWRVGHLVLPGMPTTSATFTIVGMMALFGGIAHAPLAVMLMVAEMTGNLSLLAPAMVAVGLATVVTGNRSIYRSQVPTRADSPAHRYQFSFPLLGTLSVAESMSKAEVLLDPERTVAEAERALADEVLPGAPVVDRRRRLVGVITLSDISKVPAAERDRTPVSAVMTRDPVTTVMDATLDLVQEELATHHVSWMPVVEGAQRTVVGTISAGDVALAYRSASRSSVRRMRGLSSDTMLLEMRVEGASSLAGKPLSQLHVPAGALVVSINRDDATILPRGSTRLLFGDLVTILTDPEHEEAVRSYLRAAAGSVSDVEGLP